MTWGVKVDDHFPEHPKVLALGDDYECGLEAWCLRREFDYCPIKDQDANDRLAPCYQPQHTNARVNP